MLPFCQTVYLLIGLVFMVLTLTVFYEIPQLNVGSVFLLKSDEYLTNASTYDSEKARIQGGPSLGVMPSSLGSSTTSAVPFGSYGNANLFIFSIYKGENPLKRFELNRS